jgi:hypothetical protein
MCEPEEVLRSKRLTVLRDCFALPFSAMCFARASAWITSLFGVNLEIADLNDTVHYALICKTRDRAPTSSKLP